MLSYADAARLLGGRESQLVKTLDRVTGGLPIAGASAGVPALLGWLDARTEFVRLSQELIRKVSERRTGISRYSRTQRLEAAHTVIVVTAYVEALVGGSGYRRNLVLAVASHLVRCGLAFLGRSCVGFE